MITFLWRRLIQALLVVWGVTLVTFSLFHFVGGDPALQYAGKNASPAVVASLRQELGLDRSLPLQYVYFLKQTITWDWGRSWSTKRPVTSLIKDHIGASLSLTIPAYFFSISLALFFALLMAYKKNSIWDQLLSLFCFALMSFSFLVYIIYAQKVLAFDLNLFPIYGWDPSWLKRGYYLALPCLIYTIASVSPKILLFRAALLHEVRQDYVRTAYAKGLSPLQIYSSHILKNAALPILTLITSQMPSLITGSLLLEAYFGIPGLGGLLLKAIQSSDLPLIKSITVMGSLVYILFNLLNDILATFFDARVELK
jgi:peptide/nickel transport system permease protein